MKKTVMVLMCMLFIVTLTGCGNDVSKLMEDEKYDEAYAIIKKDPDKYDSYVDECRYYLGKQATKDKKFVKAHGYFKDNEFEDAEKQLKIILSSYKSEVKAREVEKYYNEMLKEINAGKKGISYYYDLASRIDAISINTEEDVKANKEVINDLFYIEGPSLVKVNELKKKLRDAINKDAKIDVISSVTEYLWEAEDFECEFIDENTGVMIVSDVSDFLEEKNISAKSFACILATYKDYGAVITRKNETIVIRWDKSTRGYDYCATMDEHIELADWYEVNSAIVEHTGRENGKDYFTVTIKNPENIDFRFVSVVLEFYDPTYTYAYDSVYIKEENMKDNVFTTTIAVDQADYAEFNYTYLLVGSKN